MKEDPRDFIVPIRMNFSEKEKIKKRADKTGKNLSTFIRDSSLGCEIKEKPDKDFYDLVIKNMGKFIRTLDELERLLYHRNFIDERILKNMATTSLWKVETRLDKVIKYATNEDKTTDIEFEQEVYKSLHNTIEYAKADFKTEKQFYVSGVNCTSKNALQEMILTKKHFGKEKGILAYHGFQSFAEGEVTAEQAHQIGVKLAEELWGDKYEVIVATHLNTKHYHNHFVLNSVSFVDGKKYINNRENYAMMRKISDELCREYGLSVIEEKPCGKHNIDYTKYYNSYIQKSDYYTTTKDDVDFAIKQAYSYKNFETILKKMGYTITIRANKISLCRPPYKRNIRIERSFGMEYSIRNITERIMNSDMFKVPFPEEQRKYRRYT